MKRIKYIWEGDGAILVRDEYGKLYSLWIDKSEDGQPIIRLVREKKLDKTA